MNQHQRIYKVTDENNKVIGYFTSIDLIIPSLKISFSAFEMLEVKKEDIVTFKVSYRVGNHFIALYFSMEPIDLITFPVHL